MAIESISSNPTFGKKTYPKGFAGDISMLVAVNPDGTVKGTSILDGVRHIERGYYLFHEKLNALGARISLMKN